MYEDLTIGEHYVDRVNENAKWRSDQEAILCLEKVLNEDGNVSGGESVTSNVDAIYWPVVMKNINFCSPAGIMYIRGLTYTIFNAMKLVIKNFWEEIKSKHDGPFMEYRFEIGIQTELKKRAEPNAGMQTAADQHEILD